MALTNVSSSHSRYWYYTVCIVNSWRRRWRQWLSCWIRIIRSSGSISKGLSIIRRRGKIVQGKITERKGTRKTKKSKARKREEKWKRRIIKIIRIGKNNEWISGIKKAIRNARKIIKIKIKRRSIEKTLKRKRIRRNAQNEVTVGSKRLRRGRGRWQRIIDGTWRFRSEWFWRKRRSIGSRSKKTNAGRWKW
jgi:hypothetical protein